MGGGRGKKQEETYRKAADAERAAYVPTELENMRTAEVKNFLAQSKGSGGIESIDALKPYLNLYNSAVSDQQNDRQSTGILQLARGGNAQQAGVMDQYLKFKRQQDAAGQLENAYAGVNADMTGQSYNLIGIANQRMSDRAGMAQQAYSTYLNRPKQPALWEKIAGLAIGGVGAAGGVAGLAKL
jgi:hypothetical protein